MSAHDPDDRTPPHFRLDPPPDLFELPGPIIANVDPLDLPTVPPLPTPSVLGGQTIDHAHFHGRGWKLPLITAQAGDECVTICVDDERNPQLWCELILSAETVAELLARIIAMRANHEQFALDCLRTMSEHLPR